MLVTLEDIMKNAFPEKNILAIKRYLQDLKKKGFVFFKEDLLLLEPNRNFEMYYHVQPSPKSHLDAFPVSIVDFEIVFNKKDQLKFMKVFFEKYYGKKKSLEYFSLYNYKEPFVGTRYLWFTKKEECEDGTI